MVIFLELNSHPVFPISLSNARMFLLQKIRNFMVTLTKDTEGTPS